MRIAREKFWSLLVVIGYDSEEEAISIANESIYGLSGYVYSSRSTAC